MFVLRPCVLVLMSTLVAATAGAAVNYCSAKMCENVDTHTLCMYPPGPGPGYSGYIDADLSGEEKMRIVARLNRRRSEAAQGMGNLPPAANMLKLRWVEELAREAQRWADQCAPAQTPELHDECRDLYSVTVGQSVASIVGEAPGLRPESLVDMWHIQSLHYKWNVTFVPHHRKLPHEQADWHVEKIPAKESHFYGDFAQMVWAKTYMVGYGRSRFMASWRGRLRSVERLVCNFAPQGPTAGNALWAPGPAASACPVHSRPDPDLPALCTFPETLKQLQEALDRMEQEQYTKESAKVRREARVKEDNKSSFFPPGKNYYSILSQHPRAFGVSPTVPPTMKSITIPDQRKIISMVLRNVPYLRQYESTLIGNLSVGVKASNVAFCAVLFVHICL